jgi:hypothetical protein
LLKTSSKLLGDYESKMRCSKHERSPDHAMPFVGTNPNARGSLAKGTCRAEALAKADASRENKPHPAKSSLFQVKKLIQLHRPFAPHLVGGTARRAIAFATADPRAPLPLLSISFRVFRGHTPFHSLLSRLGPLASIAVSSGIKRLLAAIKIFSARILALNLCPMTPDRRLLTSVIYFPDRVNFEEFKLCTWRPKDY